MEIHVHVHNHADKEVIQLLTKLSNQNLKIMAKVSDIEAKVDALQSALDVEQAQIQAAIDKLNTTIQELRDQIAGGQTDAEALERIATKLDAIQTDLQGTIADEPTEPTP